MSDPVGWASPTAVAVAAFALASVCFSLVAVVGFYRLPDVYTRAHAASKSETLGALFGLSAAATAFGVGPELVKLGILALFVLVTGPTAAHAVARSAADSGIHPWTRSGTARDDWHRMGPAPEDATDGGGER
jgi:multicomponent Na+:H+ antiporter subunit G